MSQEDSGSLVVIDEKKSIDVFKSEDEILVLVEKVRSLATVVCDASTQKGRDEIKSVAYKIRRSKTYIDSVGKSLVDEMKALPKIIDSSRKLARDKLDELHDEIRKPLTDWEDEQERLKEEKRAAEEAEAARKKEIDDAIEQIKHAPVLAVGESSIKIKEIIGDIVLNKSTRHYLERQDEATQCIRDAMEKLEKMLSVVLSVEEHEQKERDRKIAEAATQAANEAAEKKIIESRLAQERAEMDRKAAEQRAKDAEAATEREMVAAAKREELARIDAEAAQRTAAERAIEAERQRIALEQEESRKADEVRAAHIEYRKRINNNAANELMGRAGLNIEQARAVVVAIASGKIPNISINY